MYCVEQMHRRVRRATLVKVLLCMFWSEAYTSNL